MSKRAGLIVRDLVINGFAAWPVVPGQMRRLIYSAYGMDVASGGVSPGCFFGSPRVSIGRGTTINYRCFFDSWAPIVIGRDCAVGMEVLFCTSTHRMGPSSKRAGPPTGAPITLGNGCWIGGRAVILPGVSIGDGCVIAAGAVVVRDCEPHGLFGGVPAQRIRDLPVSVDEETPDRLAA